MLKKIIHRILAHKKETEIERRKYACGYIELLTKRANRFHINALYTFKPHICQSVLASNPIAISSSLLLCAVSRFVHIHFELHSVLYSVYIVFVIWFLTFIGFFLCFSSQSVHFVLVGLWLPDANFIDSLDFTWWTQCTSRTWSLFKNSLFKLILTISLNSTFLSSNIHHFHILPQSQCIAIACTFFLGLFFIYSSITITWITNNIAKTKQRAPIEQIECVFLWPGSQNASHWYTHTDTQHKHNSTNWAACMRTRDEMEIKIT